MIRKKISQNLTSPGALDSSLYSEFDDVAFFFSGKIYKYKGVKINEKGLNKVFESISIAWKCKSIEKLMFILCHIDGEYIIQVVNKVDKRTLIISDRFGLAPLYLKRFGEKIYSWSDSLEDIIDSPECESNIDKHSIEAFIETSSFLSDTTPYKNVKRMHPATIIEIDSMTGSILYEDQYWSWNCIEDETSYSFDNAVDILHEKFSQAVKDRIEPGCNYSFTLSGGLDSRVILAEAIKHTNKNLLKCYTFGKLGSPDVKIAEKVTSIAGIAHEIDEIDENNWKIGRDAGVLRTSGMKNYFHMHGVNSIDKISSHSTWVFNGFLGDLILGGGYLVRSGNEFKRAETIAYEKYESYSSIIDCKSNYYNDEISDSVFIYNRGVRFTSMGLELVSHKSFGIKPFMDNELIEFIYSLPKDYMYEGRLYHTMLLKYYPDYFKEIPWQKTGIPIKINSEPSYFSEIKSKTRLFLINKVKGSDFEYVVRRVYNKLFSNETFVDYSSWAKDADFIEEIDLLFDGNSNCERLFGRDYVDNIVIQARNKFCIERLGCLVSIEKYLSNNRFPNEK